MVVCLTAAIAGCGGLPADPPDVIGPCADLYAQDIVPTFELDVAAADWQAIAADYSNRVKGTYYPARFRVGAEVVPDARIRLRGRTDNWIGTKMQFVIAFNRVDGDRRFHGLRKLSLDASPWDHSMLRERIGLAYLRDLGLPAACANNARLVVNGAYVGLYTSVEDADRAYLERNFARPDGDLFAIDGETGAWELETNEDDGDLVRLERYLDQTDVAAIDHLTDLEGSIAEWAGEAMIPHAEGYTAGAINFLLYDHPARGFVTLPYDLDSIFFYDDAAGADLDQADPLTFRFGSLTRPRQVTEILADPRWVAVFQAELDAALAAYDVPTLQARTTAWAAQIAADVAADPNRGFTPAQHDAAVQEIRGFVADRAAFVAAWRAAR